MRLFKNKINIIAMAFIAFVSLSCENGDDNIVVQQTLEARFASNIDFNMVSFNNLSQNASSYLWTFDDGMTSTLFEPASREYFTNGTYPVTLKAIDDNGNESIYQGSFTINLSCTFETSQSGSAVDLNISFLDNTIPFVGDNVAFNVIANPDPNDFNMSCRVGEVLRFNNSPFDNLQLDLSEKFDFNASEGISFKIWSPVPNTPVLLKLEEIGNSVNFVEIMQTTTTANTWEELTFDFAPVDSNKFNKMVIFFNFNVADGSTYYFDDLKLY